ncbi:MAG: MFS transporter [Bacteroidetes bacterium]|nr:MFS transporter [Bacteroidota bacterium]
MEAFQPNQKRTFRLHTAYTSIEGIVLGVLALNEFVFLKSLHGSNYMMSLLFQFSMVVFVALFFINEWLKRIQNRRRLLRIVALGTRLPLLVLVFFPKDEKLFDVNLHFHYVFLLVFFIYYLGALFINPNINYLLKINYSHVNFGKLYSYSATVNKIIMMSVTFLYGFWLDIDPSAYSTALPITGLLGIISLWLLSMIPYPESITQPKSKLSESIRKSAKEMIHILKTNKAFRDFELGFMFYGFSFMVSIAVIAIYFYEGLDLNYSSVAFYRNAYNLLAILLLPFFGKLIGRIDLRKFSVITYGSIILYIIFLLMTLWFPQHTTVFGIKLYYVLILYILAHGVFAATMVLLWNIGSAYFCPSEEAGTYQSVHLFLTGFRALFAPTLGVFFYEKYGIVMAFGIAIVFLIIAIAINLRSYYLEKSKLTLRRNG